MFFFIVVVVVVYSFTGKINLYIYKFIFKAVLQKNIISFKTKFILLTLKKVVGDDEAMKKQKPKAKILFHDPEYDFM